MRPSGRETSQMRVLRFVPDYTMHAEGSVLAEFGDTRVICTASVEQGVPRFMRGEGRGWVTAEYGMLPIPDPGAKRHAASRADERSRFSGSSDDRCVP